MEATDPSRLTVRRRMREVRPEARCSISPISLFHPGGRFFVPTSPCCGAAPAQRMAVACGRDDLRGAPPHLMAALPRRSPRPLSLARRGRTTQREPAVRAHALMQTMSVQAPWRSRLRAAVSRRHGVITGRPGKTVRTAPATRPGSLPIPRPRRSQRAQSIRTCRGPAVRSPWARFVSAL